MKKTTRLFILISAFLLGFISCSDDDNSTPITIKDYEGALIRLIYPSSTENGISFILEGGDGNYSVKSGNDKIVTAVMLSATELCLKAISIGETIVTITDNANNILVLEIHTDYKTEGFIVKKHDIRIVGGDLTDNEKKAISQKYLSEIPVGIDGGYQFIFTEMPNNKGKAIIYPKTFGSEGIESTFEIIKIENDDIPESNEWGYEVVINNEKRVFIQGKYYHSTKSMLIPPMALYENVTQNVQKEYPKAELAYTSQLIIKYRQK